MSRYQGRNLPDLLELLEPVVYPDPVSLMPATVGWPVLLIWLLGMLVVGLVHWRRRWLANAYRRVARAEIAQLRVSAGDAQQVAAGIAGIVKRAALVAYPRSEVAHLAGSDWQRFLENSCQRDPQIVAAAALLAKAAYLPDPDPDAIAAPALRWIDKHRV
jgi:hypothetical protein